MVIHSIRPLLAIGVSLLASILIIFSGKKPNLRESWTIIAGIIKFAIVASMIPAVLSGSTYEYTLVSFFPGMELKFRVDSFGLMYATLASFLWIANSFYSIGYMRTLKEHSQTRYYACFAGALSAAMGAAFSANLLTLYLFYELITMVTYPLVSHKETPDAFSGGKKYITYLLGTSKAFLLPAIVLTYIVAGTLEFSKHGIFPAAANPMLLKVIYLLFILGIAKAALMPFHGWLPAAMVAPTPVSALLHAVVVVKVGVFAVIRVILFIFGLDMMRRLNLGAPTAFAASFTIVTASVIALTKDNLKARLAYSTISQLSYIILGAALLSPSGVAGGVMHIVNHALAKITLFFCAGSIYVASHKTNISELDGIGKKMPFTMAAFAIGTLGMIGAPPVGGFVTKLYLSVGSMQADELAVLFVLLSSTLLNGAYFIPIVYKAFFREMHVESGHGDHGHDRDSHHSGHDEEIRENPYLVVPLMVTAIGSIIVGLYPNIVMAFIRGL